MYFARPPLLGARVEQLIIEVFTTRGYEVVNPDDSQLRDWTNVAESCDTCFFVPFPETMAIKKLLPSNKPRVSVYIAFVVNAFVEREKPVYWARPDIRRAAELRLRTFEDWDEFRLLSVAETELLLATK
ncbi:MAG TPA: hypothetical protein VMU13_00825 [Candidatus Paceibacterota bacterium]|nr:hypothetical protein [Candidatus Paceibacterota bacterium]